MSRPNRLLQDKSGNVLILVALSILVILGFFALGVEAGRWYLVRAELSKSVDAGALAGAKNISNPHVDAEAIAEEFSQENFAAGTLGTPGAGAGTVTFAAVRDGDRVSVDGQTHGLPVVAQLFGVDHVGISSLGAAQMKEVEIMLVLDRSGSMAGQPIADLKVAATSFVDFFADTEDRDRVGLVTFATSGTMVRPVGNNFVAPMRASINAMNAVGATNPGEALRLASGPDGLIDRTGGGVQRIPQFLVFFSDGRPTAFRGTFRYRNNVFDANACVTGNCEPWDIGNGVVTHNNMGFPDREQWMGISPRTTGDGLIASACGNGNTTRWMMFDQRPIPGYGPQACNIPYRTALASYVCNTAANTAIENAQALKDRNVTIYAIGIGTVNAQFLETLASSPEYVYFTPDSDQLASIFQKVAKQIKLRMVQ